MEKQPDEPEDFTNEPQPSMSEPMEVQDAVASTSATPFAQPIIAASKSKAQKQREYRQRIAASRTPPQAAAEPITAAPKTRAQIQREYRQRIAKSKTPAQAAAAREARNVRDRNNRLRQAANLAIASGSLKATTTSSSRSGQRLNTVHIETQRQFTDQQRQTLATEPAETVQPSSSSDQIEVQAHSTLNTKYASSIMRFKSSFLDNDFGYACSVCDRLWFRNDLKPITAAQLKTQNFSDVIRPHAGPFKKRRRGFTNLEGFTKKDAEAGIPSGSSSTSQQDKQLIALPEGKVIISNVYRYLQAEFDHLKSFTGNSCDLSPLSDVLKRTADATGVSEQTVTAILGERKRTENSARLETVKKKRKKPILRCEEEDIGSIEEDSKSEGSDGEQHTDEDGKIEVLEHEIETVKIEIEEPDLVNRRIEVEIDPTESTTAVQHLLPTHVTVKAEPDDSEYRQSGSAVQNDITDGTLVVVKIEPPEDFTQTCSMQSSLVPQNKPDRDKGVAAKPPEDRR